MDGGRTTTRQYSEYSDFCFIQREPEYDQDTDLHQRESTQVKSCQSVFRTSAVARTFRPAVSEDNSVQPRYSPPRLRYHMYFVNHF